MKCLPQTTRRALAVLAAASTLLFGCSSPAQPPLAASTPTTDFPQEIVLTMGSWRTEDVQQMNRILARFHDQYPGITIKFDPTKATEYNAALQAQLEKGTAPDLFYLRSYATSQQLFDKGYLESLNDLPGLTDNFVPAMLAPWATDDGQIYGVPFIATSHGVYYNVDLFKKLNLQTPQTWQELLTTAQVIKANGVIPFANATGDKWTIAEIVFMNLAPNFIGGREGRMEYLAGKRCFNDAHIVAAFQAVKDLAPFLPDGHESIKYADSQQLFLQGRAAMWMGGSWDIPFFEAEGPAFEWSVFATPPPAGQPGYVTFQLDAGMGMNVASQHKPEARLFLEWMTTPEFARLMGDELPGFFPMSRQAPALENAHANAFLALNKSRGTDVRFVWEKLVEGSPSGYDLVQDGAVAVLKEEQTPQQAAEALQAGLAQWFEPAQRCSR
jgi:raffinose/stachyose/melibiose transport system substrate-binding protein